MRIIIPDRLWIANAIQVRDLRAVLATGTTAIVKDPDGRNVILTQPS